MRVTIETKECSCPIYAGQTFGFFGLFSEAKYTYRPGWQVCVTVELSQEERAILSARQLWDVTLYMHDIDQSDYSAESLRMYGDVKQLPVSIKEFVEGKPYFAEMCRDPVAAKALEHRLETELLPRLKSFIDGSAAPSPKKTFEL
jgi:hypothetical protein